MKTLRKLKAGKYRSRGFYEFYINERGKIRRIRSVDIDERVVQRTLCDYCLVPLLTRSFTKDNSASQKGKGYHFAMKRLKKHLTSYFHRNGNDGYILLYDFKNFFDSISHDKVKKIIRKHISDTRLIDLCDHFIDCFNDGYDESNINNKFGHSLGLGSQISQVLALAMADIIQHYIKEVMHIKESAAYMDDGYVIAKDKDTLRQCIEALKILAGKLELNLNWNKVHVVKLSHGFTYCKKRIWLKGSGKIVMKICKQSVRVERVKLKKHAKWVAEGRMTIPEAYQGYQSWRAYAKHCDAYRTIGKMNWLFSDLFLNGVNINFIYHFIGGHKYGQETCIDDC